MRTKLKCSFENMELADRIVAVPVGENVDDFHGVIRMNETAARMVELLKNEITEEEIIQKLLEEYNAPQELIANDVHRYIKELQTRGLLEA